MIKMLRRGRAIYVVIGQSVCCGCGTLHSQRNACDGSFQAFCSDDCYDDTMSELYFDFECSCEVNDGTFWLCDVCCTTADPQDQLWTEESDYQLYLIECEDRASRTRRVTE